MGQHAAAVREGSQPVADTVLDRVISSYTPTLQALAQARRGCERPGRTLAVPAAPGPQLPDEAVHIAGAFQLGGRRTCHRHPVAGQRAAGSRRG